MKNCPNRENLQYKNTDGVRSATAVFEDFISTKRSEGKSDYTLTTYRNHFRFFTKSIGGDCDIREISTYHYNEFVKVLRERNVSPATIKSYGNSLRSFFNWCYETGEIYYSVNIPLLKAQTKIKQVYADDELRKLLKKPNLSRCSFTEYKIWVLENLAISTGLRISSMLGIKVGDISLDDGSIIINITKNKEALVTYMNRDMQKILKEYLSYRNPKTNDDYLFCTDYGKKLARRSAQDEIAEYNRARGVNKTSCHLFRHTFAKNSISSGQDIVTLMRMLQHSDISTTYRYLRTLGLDIKDKVDIYNPQQLYAENSRIKMH